MTRTLAHKLFLCII